MNLSNETQNNNVSVNSNWIENDRNRWTISERDEFEKQRILLETEINNGNNEVNSLFKLIFIYKKLNRFDKFEEWINTILPSHPLSEPIWLDYINHKLSLIKTSESDSLHRKENMKHVLELFKASLSDFPYFRIGFLYFDVLWDEIQRGNDMYRGEFCETLRAFKNIYELDYDYSNKFYTHWIHTIDGNNISAIYDLYLERWSIPHLGIEWLWDEYRKWDSNKERINETEKKYQETWKRCTYITTFNIEYDAIIENKDGYDALSNTATILSYIKKHEISLLSIDKNYLTLYYEKSWMKYPNCKDWWNAYITFITNPNTSQGSDVNNILQIIKRSIRCTNSDVTFILKYLQYKESTPSTVSTTLKQDIEDFIESQIDNSKSKIELQKYYLEYLCRSYPSIISDLTLIRDKFSEIANEINNFEYIDIIYHIWAEFETYKTKSVSYWNNIMDLFCSYDNHSVNSYRAYIYYIKTIGDNDDIRKVYKIAFDSVSAENKEWICKNWLEWEKLFGSIATINAMIGYTASGKQGNIGEISTDENKKKVIIKGINPETTESDVTRYISVKSPFIKIKSIRLVRDENGKSRNFLFIDWLNEQDAGNLVRDINGTCIPPYTNTITCAISKPPKLGENDSRTVFLNNLSFDITEDEIKTALNKYGNILEVRLIYNNKTQKPRGYCYVEFQNEDSVNSWITDKERLVIKERKIIVEKSVSAARMRMSYTGHITNWSFKVNEKEWKDALASKAEINEKDIWKIRICKDEEGKSKGFGFVECGSKQALDKVIQLTGLKIRGRNIVITLSNRQITEKKQRNESRSMSISLNGKEESVEIKNQWNAKESENDKNNIVLNRKRKDKLSNNDFKKLFS